MWAGGGSSRAGPLEALLEKRLRRNSCASLFYAKAVLAAGEKGMLPTVLTYGSIFKCQSKLTVAFVGSSCTVPDLRSSILHCWLTLYYSILRRGAAILLLLSTT